MSAKADIRFGNIDGERTECILIGRLESEGTDPGQVVVGLPYTGDHQGSWTTFEVPMPDSSKLKVRLTTVSDAAKRGLRKKPHHLWAKDSWARFSGPVAQVLTETLWEAYSARAQLETENATRIQGHNQSKQARHQRDYVVD